MSACLESIKDQLNDDDIYQRLKSAERSVIGKSKKKQKLLAVADLEISELKAMEARLLTDAKAALDKVTPKPEERRVNSDLRKKVSEMTAEEARAALLTDDMTGLGNRRAYNESEKLPAQVYIDADGLKWVNDNLSHDSGDHLLKAIGDALKIVSDNAYHVSGDEYYLQANSLEEANEIMAKADEILSQATIEGVTKNGESFSLTGIGISYGISEDIKDAEVKAGQSKTDREAAGLRAGRGERPKNAIIGSGSRQDNESDVAETKKSEVTESKPEKENTGKTYTGDSGKELIHNLRGKSKTGIKWDDLADKNETLRVKEATKQNVYPKPDYTALVENGMQPVFAHLVKQVYDSIATSPNVRKIPTDEDIKTYIAGVNRVMDGVMAWIEANDGAKAMVQNLATSAARMNRVYGGEAINLGDLGKNSTEAVSLLNYVYGEPGWRSYKSEVSIVGSNKMLGALQPGMDEMAKALKEVGKGFPAKQESWQRSGYKVFKGDNLSARTYFGKDHNDKPYGSVTINDGRYTVEQKTFNDSIDGDKEVEDYKNKRLDELKGKFLFTDKYSRLISAHDTEAEANEAARDKVKKEKSKGKISEKGIKVESAQRKGVSYRMEGEDISSDKLRETFGLTAINFGEWMHGDSPAKIKERQLHLNHAYDAFMDLAGILGIPPKAISLNSMLGLAIGAQGRAGAAAHFYPGANEINLTRASGAGSLGHEMAHAIDHYFAVQAGISRETNPFVTEHILKLKREPGNLRPEIIAAFEKIVNAMTKRKMTKAELDEIDKNHIARLERNIEGWLKNIRKDYSGLEDEFDKLAEKARASDLGEGKIAISPTKNLSPLLVEMRDLYKKKSKRIYPIDSILSLQGNLDSKKYRQDHINQESEHQPQTTSNYLGKASGLESKSGKRYWTTPWELFARAFDAFVSDTLEANGGENSYLSHTGRTGDTVPEGEERAAINDAFKILISELKTKETDAGPVLYSKSGNKLSGSTVSSIEKALPSYAQKMLTSGKLQVVQSANDAPASANSFDADGIEGYYDPKADVIYVVADRVNSDNLASVLRHELLHRAIRTDEKVQSVIAGFSDKMERRFNLAKKGLGSKIENAAAKRVIAANTANSDQLEEFQAYLISEYQKAPNGLVESVKKAIQNLVSSIRAALMRVGVPFKELKPSDLAALAKYGVKSGKTVSTDLVKRGGFVNRLRSSKSQRFYSALNRAFINAPDKVFGNGKQISQWLNSNAAKLGIKADEIYFSGINDWLSMQGKVNRDDVMAYLKDGGIQVEDVTLGGKANNNHDTEISRIARDHGYKIASDMDEDTYYFINQDDEDVSFDELPETLQSALNNYEKNRTKLNKYAQYTVPGGDNYQELLLTLPVDKGATGNSGTISFNNEDHVDDFLTDLSSDGYEDLDYGRVNDSTIEFDGINEKDKAYFIKLANQYDAKIEFTKIPTKDFYRSSHWDQPNVIAHTRFDERTDANGDKVLFVHEIQSDWGQEGKKKGFKSGDNSQKGITEAQMNEFDSIAAIPFRERTRAQRDRLIELNTIRAGSDEITGKYDGKVQPAPFVQDTKSWVSLAIKKLISHAVDNGIDRIAFINGGQAADLYDLRNHIKSINYEPAGENTGLYEVVAHDLEDKQVFWEDEIDLKRVEEVFGKDIAKKIESGQGEETGGAFRDWKKITGDSLATGGEGMKAFYDQIVPSVARDIAKRMGGEVGAVEVRGERTRDSQGIPSQRGQLMEQAALTITPAMRDKVLSEGMPLFSKKKTSAISPNNDNIKFSRAMPFDALNNAPDWAKPFAEKATQEIQDRFQSSKTFGALNKTVNTQAYKAWKDPDYARVFNKSVAFEHSTAKLANSAADLAPSLLPKLESFKESAIETVRGFRRIADAKKVGKAIFDTTINDKPMTEDELIGAGYTQDQITQYREFFAAINKSLDDLALSEMTRMAKALKLNLYRGNDIIEAAENYAVQVDDPNQAKDFIDKAEAITELKNKGYAPLQRFGQYTVTVKNPDNDKLIYFGMYESESEANKDKRMLQEEYPDADVINGIMSQNDWQMFKGVTPESMEVFAKVMGIDQDMAFQEYLKLAITNRSAMKRLIHRKKIAGYAVDPQRVLATFITSNARMAAKNLHMGDMLAAIADIPKEKGDVKDEAVDLYNYVQNPGAAGAGARNLLFAWYLGGSIAASAVNLTQSFTTTYPALHTLGSGKAVLAELTNAMRLAMNTSFASPELRKALKRADEEGVTAPQELHMLYGESMRAGFAGAIKPLRPLVKAWGSLFSLAEGYNRRVAFIAAYNLASGSTEERFKKAEEMVDTTQFIYSKSARPNAARSTAGSLIFTFKTFSINYLEFLKKLPPKERAIALGVLILFAGASGAPGADDLDDLIDTIGQSLGYNTNAKGWKDENINHLILYGMSSVLPIDVGSRLGVGNIIPGTAVLKQSETDKSRDVLEVMGASGSLVKNIVEAFGAASTRQGIGGKVAAASHALLPKALGDLAKAVDMAETGKYRDYTGKNITDASFSDAVFKGIGFQPEKVAAVRRPQRIMKQYKDMAVKVESDLADLWADGVYEKDQDKVVEAKQLLKDWNLKNPQTPIRIKYTQILRRVKAMRRSSGERLLKTTPKELRRFVANGMNN